MWSDQIPANRMRELVAALHAALPAPAPETSHWREELHARPCPEQVAELLRSEPGFVWLDGGPSPHFLFHQPLAVVSCDGKNASVRGPGGRVQFAARGLELLEAMLAAWSGPSRAMLVGFLSYDVACEIEELDPLPPADFAFPTLHFALFDRALAFENSRWWLEGTDAWGAVSRPAPWFEEALRWAESISVPLRGIESALSGGTVSSRPDRACFEAAVARIVERIHRGDFFQTNLCRRLETTLDAGKAWDLYRKMRSISPARYGAFLSANDGQTVLSVSPELFLKVDGDRSVESRPIKGTRPRGRTAREDRDLAGELLSSEKDRAELAMIVDVMRNDLSRVCESGSVNVARHAELETLPTVHHTVSTVRGRLRAGTSAVSLLRAAFPAASITGAPKIEAMRAASAEERQLRGPAMGAIGWIALDGRMELSVAIRTAFVTGGRALYYAGGGITADSDPAAEFEETGHKASAFLRALSSTGMG